MTSGLRDAIQGAIADGSHQPAAALLCQLMREQPSASNASYVVARFAELAPHLNLAGCRLALLRSFTVEPVVPLLRARCFAAGIDATVHVGGFNAYAQEVLDPESALYQFDPDIAIMAVRTADVVPALWHEFVDLGEAEVATIVETALADFKSLVETFRRRCRAHLILHNLECPACPPQGVLATRQRASLEGAIQHLNRGLQELAQAHPGVYVLDYDGLLARYGRLRWHDESKWLTLRMPIAADCLIHLADEYMKFIHPLTGKICKALVVDLDGTLWGGVVGEDGLQGIQLGLDHPGAAYRAFQRAILDLHRRGIILAICSRNDPADALEVLERHPHMLLRPAHFAAMRINWSDKAQNLADMAAELNIAPEAMAFVDDSAVERASVRIRMPDVFVLDLPADPVLFARALRECPAFERVSLSEEDRERGRLYAAQRQGAELQRAARSPEEFYHSLQMKAEIAEVGPETIGRVAQLIAKTNQFNLTTRRHTEQDLAQMMADARVRIFSLRLTDRFGDNGIVGVAISHLKEERCEIETFLLSCRVIGRTVETALLACVAEQARRDGARRLVGLYVPTKKNGAVSGFYGRHGFTSVAEQADRTLWFLDLAQGQILAPAWIDCRYVQKDGASCGMR